MAGQNPGSPTDFQYFYEDEVYKINNRGQVVFGLVLENYEANSSDQESDIETPIQKGEIRVVWHPSGTERVISEKSVSEDNYKISYLISRGVWHLRTEVVIENIIRPVLASTTTPKPGARANFLK